MTITYLNGELKINNKPYLLIGSSKVDDNSFELITNNGVFNIVLSNATINGNNLNITQALDLFPNILKEFTVDSWKLKAILGKMNLINTIETALNGLPEPQKTYANLSWSSSPTIRSSSITTKFFQSVLKLSDEQLEEIFINANNIEI